MDSEAELDERAMHYKSAIQDLREQVLIDESMRRLRRSFIERGIYDLFDDDDKI